MYTILRFDDEVAAQDVDAILNSMFLKDVLIAVEMPEAPERFDELTENSSLVYATDSRFPVSHVLIEDAPGLPNDILYCYLGKGSKECGTEEILEKLTKLEMPGDDVVGEQRYAWLRMLLDLGEITGTVGGLETIHCVQMGEAVMTFALFKGNSQVYENSLRASVAAADAQDGESAVVDDIPPAVYVDGREPGVQLSAGAPVDELPAAEEQLVVMPSTDTVQ